MPESRLNLHPFIRFSRPHTIVATGVQVVVLFILAGGLSESWPRGGRILLPALAAALALNVYIVGINQITDVDIDRLNKPYLPLASGAYSLRQGWLIVLVAGAAALGLALLEGPFLLLTVGLAFLIGTLYSWPPIRLKRHAVWAALSIAFVRGVVSNVGLYWHFRHTLGLPTALPPLIAGAALFFFGFGLVIALYKDIPDLEGDRHFTVRTFTVRLGPQRVFVLGRGILTGFYLIPVVYFLAQLPQPAAVLLLAAHLALVVLFWSLSTGVNPAEARSMARFYLTLWGLFYAEYFLLGLRGLPVFGPIN